MWMTVLRDLAHFTKTTCQHYTFLIHTPWNVICSVYAPTTWYPHHIYTYIHTYIHTYIYIYNMILRSICEKYKPGNEGFCLEISPSRLQPLGDTSSKSPELPGLYFSHIDLKIMLYIIYVTIIFTDTICMQDCTCTIEAPGTRMCN